MISVWSSITNNYLSFFFFFFIQYFILFHWQPVGYQTEKRAPDPKNPRNSKGFVASDYI